MIIAVFVKFCRYWILMAEKIIAKGNYQLSYNLLIYQNY